MTKFPIPETYLKLFEFTPWKFLTEAIVTLLETTAPKNARLLDLMCGPAHLLSVIRDRRPDLSLVGLDNDDQFINYSSDRHPTIKFIRKNVLEYSPGERFDIVICTGGLHHLREDDKFVLLKRIGQWLNHGGYVIVGDPYIDDFSTERERKLASCKLGYEYINFTIENGGSDDVIEETIAILENDIFHYENKTSIRRIMPLFEKAFKDVSIKKTFPSYTSDFGDYYFFCRNS
jgi:SAM-dependent methyltransferase